MSIEDRILEYSNNFKKNMMMEKKLHPYIFNSWRSILYTEKGKKVGVSDEWRSFEIFYNDVVGSYKNGLRLHRPNKEEIFSKNNYMWISDNDLYLLKGNLVYIDIDGVSKTIKEWSSISGRTIASIKYRYYKKDKFTNKEIVYGRMSRPRRIMKSISESDNIRAKVSKMCSSYRIKDLKKVLFYNLDIDWFLENIAYKNCIYCGDSENVGCDRIDNSIGHIKTNVVPCCYTCNVVRNILFTVEEMKELGSTISKIKNKRKNG